MKNLKSYRGVGRSGRQVMVIITHKECTLKYLNELLQDGMRATAIDERSHLVNKDYVD